MVGPPPPAEWGHCWVLGEELFTNGSALWCVEGSGGRVLRVDPELDEPLGLVNSSVARLATSLWLVTSWSAQVTSIHNSGSPVVALIEEQLQGCDPDVFSVRGSFWKETCEQVRYAGPRQFRIRRG
jgi:hypothetical protein